MGLRSTLTKVGVYLGLVEEPVQDLDPRIDWHVEQALFHGLGDDERIVIKTTPGEWVGWTDNYGNRDEMQCHAEAIEITSFVRYRLGVLQQARGRTHRA